MISTEEDPSHPGTFPLRHQAEDPSELICRQTGLHQSRLLQAGYRGGEDLGRDCTEVVVIQCEGSQVVMFGVCQPLKYSRDLARSGGM